MTIQERRERIIALIARYESEIASGQDNGPRDIPHMVKGRWQYSTAKEGSLNACRVALKQVDAQIEAQQ